MGDWMGRGPTRTDPVDTETTNLVAWRYSQLRLAGSDSDNAMIVSQRTDISLHDAIDLLDHHCPPNLMVAILT